MSESTSNAGRRLVDRLLSAVGAVVITLVFFLVLPLIQAISKPPRPDTEYRAVDTAVEPPPPPVVEEEPEPEEAEEEPPPELVEDAPPLDLSQLELALNPGGIGDGLLAGDFTINLNTVMAGGGDVDALFSMAELDQKPRVIHQVPPARNASVRKKSPGTAKIIYIIDEEGRVKNPKVQTASDPIFERPALAALKQWKYEPGKRNGKPVATRARITISFPED